MTQNTVLIPILGLFDAPAAQKARSCSLQAPHLVDESLGDLGVDVIGHHEAQEELVHDLQVRPRGPAVLQETGYWFPKSFFAVSEHKNCELESA